MLTEPHPSTKQILPLFYRKWNVMTVNYFPVFVFAQAFLKIYLLTHLLYLSFNPLF